MLTLEFFFKIDFGETVGKRFTDESELAHFIRGQCFPWICAFWPKQST